MQIGIANNFNYSQNNINSKQNNVSFGHIKLSDKYKKRLIDTATVEQAKVVLEICNKPIDLKKLVGYDTLPKAHKKIFDDFYSKLPEEEKKDFTVEVDPSYGWGSDFICHTCMANDDYCFGKADINLKMLRPNYDTENDSVSCSASNAKINVTGGKYGIFAARSFLLRDVSKVTDENLGFKFDPKAIITDKEDHYIIKYAPMVLTDNIFKVIRGVVISDISSTAKIESDERRKKAEAEIDAKRKTAVSEIFK